MLKKQKRKDVIVLVDDNDINLTIGQKILSERYIVVTASSAEKMFRVLENIIPDMILLDIEMPEMDGYEAMESLKSKPQIKDIPVIFLTGRTDSSDKEKGLSLGAIDYIVKPYQPDFLFKSIGAGLKHYKATPKVRSFLYHSVSCGE